MYIKNFLIFLTILVAGCVSRTPITPQPTATTNPADVQESYLKYMSLYGSYDEDISANIAVLLPMSGPAKMAGNSIKTSIELAFLQNTKQNITVSFYDLSGDKTQRSNIIENVISSNPDIIIGPLFAEDVSILQEKKPLNIPVISFTSDTKVLGDNITTVNLIPTQSIETIVHQMQSDGATSMILFAPNDNSGKLMAAVADKAANVYNIPIKGVFYYDSKNSESIKTVAMRATMYNARSAANTRAREILSDILNKESLDAQTKQNLKNQLEKISRTDTLGKIPYDAILFLGDGEDAKTITSFLRYYGVGNRDVALYGTTLWDNSDIASDFSLSGAKYATLPDISDKFVNLYNTIDGHNPDYLAAFGYDAATLTLGMLYSQKPQLSYLFDPSGYVGTVGIFRLQPSGESERGLRIMELNGSGVASVSKNAPKTFLSQIYSINNISNLSNISEKELVTPGINPGDYITIPEHLRKKSVYKTKTFGANYINNDGENIQPTTIQIYEFAPEEPITNPEFEPIELETVSRNYIDSVEISE